MFRRRRPSAPDPTETGEVDPPADGLAGADPSEPTRPDQEQGNEPAAKPRRPDGPWDESEVDLHDPQQQGNRIDLGGLVVRGEQGMQLQLQVDEQTGAAASALVVVEDAAVQVLAVAAPRSSAMWPQTREQIAADATRRGGTATEADGPFGTELRLAMPVQLPNGTKGIQASRMVGIDGPRWLLRATFLGRAAAEEEAFGRLAAVVKDIVVVRGGHAMAPGDVIPLRLPREAEAAEAPADRRPGLDDLEPGPTITEIR